MTFCKLSQGYALNNDLVGGVFQAGGYAKKCITIKCIIYSITGMSVALLLAVSTQYSQL